MEDKLFNDIAKMLSKTIHDINNPLFIVTGQLSIAEMFLSKDEPDLGKIKTALSKVRKGGESMQEKMGQLRNFYRIGMDDSEFQNWSALTAGLQYLFQAHEGINIEFQLPSTPLINHPPSRVFLALYELISNLSEKELQLKIEHQNDEILVESAAISSGIEGERFLFNAAGQVKLRL